MKKITLYTILIIVFCSCQNKKEETNIASEEIKNINEIVEAIIIQDSLNVFSKSEDSTMFCSELRRLNIYIPEKRNDGLNLPPPPQDIYITQLINSKTKEESFFSSKDSLYLLKQNSNPEKLKIGKDLINKLNSTTIEKAIIRNKKVHPFRFYEMTIPVLSLDRQKAYVQLGYHCGGLCGNGKAIYLKKVNGKWKIIEKWKTWIS
jgi:tRNA nucleotidyltransferase/poly(A) polymerase